MSPIDETMAGIIRESVDLEMNARLFYEHAAAATRNKIGKRMFKRLAREETWHMKEAGEIFTSILGNDEWKEIARRERARGAPSALVERFEAAVAGWGGEERANDSEALRMAMELERRAIRFFEDLAGKADDPKARELAGKLADEETFRYDLLQAQLDSVLNMGFWLDVAEFRMDAKY